MKTLELSVLIPTLGDRPKMLGEVIGAVYDQFSVGRVEVRTIEGHSWGEGLNRLISQAKGRYLSCCCDDTVPQEGWFNAGRAMLDQGVEPASRYFTLDGDPLHPVDEMPHGELVGWCRSFLLTREMFEVVGPFIDATWYADWDYSERLKAAGWEIRACDGFAFTHLDGRRDWLTAAEDARQRAEYQASHVRQGILT